jgi:hypothetical protein
MAQTQIDVRLIFSFLDDAYFVVHSRELHICNVNSSNVGIFNLFSHETFHNLQDNFAFYWLSRLDNFTMFET